MFVQFGCASQLMARIIMRDNYGPVFFLFIAILSWKKQCRFLELQLQPQR